MRYIISLFLTFMLITTPAFAGGGHNHGHGHSHGPVSQSEAENIARKIVANLAQDQKVDSSWQSMDVSESSQKRFGGQMEWVVVFKNGGITDPEKQTLYIFLSLDGRYIAANYTGN